MIARYPRAFVLQGPRRQGQHRRLRIAENAPPDVRTSSTTTRGILPYDAPAGVTITGSGSPTTTAATGTGAGALVFSGSAAATTTAATGSGAGALVFSGSCAATTSAATASGAGAVVFEGSCAATTDAATGAGAGALVFVGACAATTDAATCAGAALTFDPPPPPIPPLSLRAWGTSTDLEATGTAALLTCQGTGTDLATEASTRTSLTSTNTSTELDAMARVVRVATDSADVYNFTCKNADGTAYDLTGCTVELEVRPRRAGTSRTTLSATIVTAASGTAKYEWDGTELVPGEYDVRAAVTTSTSKVLHFPNRKWEELEVIP